MTQSPHTFYKYTKANELQINVTIKAIIESGKNYIHECITELHDKWDHAYDINTTINNTNLTNLFKSIKVLHLGADG